MNSIQLSIEATEEIQELLISTLSDTGATGFEQTETHLLAYYDENNFPSYDVKKLLEGYTFNSSIIEEQNWNADWEKSFEPVVVNDYCAIRAHFHAPIPNVRHEIIITPKMSFGTGHHATTYMMIEGIQNIDMNGKTVFDFGTGTGILAILAKKEGAQQVLAIDIDEWSINNAKENIYQNNCNDIELQLMSEVPAKKFDVILANINKNVIIENLEALKNALNPNGFLLLSGLLVVDEEDINAACVKASLKLVNKRERNNWISLLYSL